MQDAQESRTTPFATPIQSAETMTAQVVAHLKRVYAPTVTDGINLEQIARTAVERFRDARVKTFVPVLALRDAREALTRTAA